LRPILPALQAVVELLQILPEVPAVLPVRDAVHAGARVLSQTGPGAFQRPHRQKVSDRGELHLLLPPSQFSYSVEFRGHACSISEYRHVSLDQCVRLFPPSLPWVPALTSSPRSSVLRGRKTPPCPSRPSPVSLDGAVPRR